MFVETPRFLDDVAVWLVGGRGFDTVIARTYGGKEYRNQAWDQALGIWELSRAARMAPQDHPMSMQKLYAYYLGMRAEFTGFRLKAPNDNADNGLGILGLTGLGVASTTAYQMYKKYSYTPASYTQKVGKPVASSIGIYIAGVLKTLTTHYTLDSTTGIVTFTSQPTIGAAITWVGNYDIPVRFGMPMPAQGRESGSGALHVWNQLKLIELRDAT